MRKWLSESNVDINDAPTIGSAILLGTIGVLSFIVQPGLVQGFVEELQLTEAAANDLAFIEMVGVAIGTYIVALRGAMLGWRWIVFVSLLLAVAGNSASALMTTGEWLPGARFLTGLGEGGVICVSFAVVGVTTRVERNLALYLVLLLTYGALGLWAMPWALQTIGLRGVFVLWSVLTALSIFTVSHLPTSAQTVARIRPTASVLPLGMVVAAMLGVLIFNSAIGIAWANLFLIGMQIRPDEQAVANALLLCQFVAIFGALAAVMLETHLGRWWPIIAGIFGCAAFVSLLLGQPGYLSFVIAVCGFNFLWNFVLPFILSAVSDMDTRGDIMSRAIAVQMTGLGFGPFIAARIFGLGGGFSVVLWTTIIMLVSSFFVLGVPMLAHDREGRSSA